MKADVNLELMLDEETSVIAKHIKLLKAIDKTGSITKAAQEIGISYKNAWDSLDIINNKSDKPLIIRSDGKKRNSGSGLSEYGKKMVEIYDTILLTQREFLAKICDKIDVSTQEIANFSRMGMHLSARNQLNCEISQIISGAVNTQVVARLSSGSELVANITKESESQLNLSVAKRVIFIFKAPAVMISKDENDLKLSARNQLEGEIISVKIGAVNAQITLKISSDQTITSIITKESAISMRLGVGDVVRAIVKSNDIIIGA